MFNILRLGEYSCSRLEAEWKASYLDSRFQFGSRFGLHGVFCLMNSRITYNFNNLILNLKYQTYCTPSLSNPEAHYSHWHMDCDLRLPCLHHDRNTWSNAKMGNEQQVLNPCGYKCTFDELFSLLLANRSLCQVASPTPTHWGRDRVSLSASTLFPVQLCEIPNNRYQTATRK